VPMRMYDEFHDMTRKSLLNGVVLEAHPEFDPETQQDTGAAALADVNAAVDMLFNHPNCPPFICKQLIQKLVTSNPSPAYVTRVASKFVNNGSGVRGDMQAVIRAILLDDEARKPQFFETVESGKMKEPYLRTANLNVPNAVTVVSVDDFTRGNIDWRRARRADRNALASVNPVLDPLLLTPLRNAVVNSAWGRGKIDVPPGIARKLRDTTVVTSTTPAAPPFRPDLAKSMRVNSAPDRAKGQKFQVRDERQGHGRGSAPAPAPQAAQKVEQPRAAEQPRVVEQRRQPRVVEQPQRQQQRVERPARAAQAERPVRPAQQQPRGERVAAPQPPHAQPHAQPQPKQQKQERPGKPGGGPPSQGGGAKGKGKKP